MSTHSQYVKKEFNDQWKIYKSSYEDLVKKMKDPNHVICDYSILGQVHRAVLQNRYIAEHFSKDATMLEVACGNGINANYLLSQGYKVTAFDPSEEGIRRAQQLAETLGGNPQSFFVSDQQHLETFKSDSVDVLISIGLFRYLEKDVRDFFYRQASRILKKGGAFILTNDNALFDIFAMNDWTTAFWAKTVSEFSDVQSLFSGQTVKDLFEEKLRLLKRQFDRESVSQHMTVHAENPLTYAQTVCPYGFTVIKNVFPDCHVLPPHIEKEVPADKIFELKARICLPNADHWAAMFMGPEMLSFLRKE